MGMYRDPQTFVRFTPPSPVLPSADLIYSSSNQAPFRFINREITLHQNHYLDKLVELLKQKEVPLAMMNIPQYSERDSDKIIERLDWSKKFGAETPLIGISPKALFTGLSNEEVEKLHCDREHFNMNGNEFFTRTMLPAILEVYKKHATKSF
jgi:hypothetical protein